MARSIERLRAEQTVVAELRAVRGPRQSACATVSEPTSFCSALEGLGVEAVAEQLDTTAKRVSLWSGRFASPASMGLPMRQAVAEATSIAEAKMSGSLPEATRPRPGRNRWGHPLDGPAMSASRPASIATSHTGGFLGWQAYGDRSVDNSVIAIARYQAHEKFLSCR